MAPFLLLQRLNKDLTLKTKSLYRCSSKLGT